MNETESVVDDVASVISLSDSTIYSNLNDAISRADSRDIDNEAGPIVKELERTTKHKPHNDVDEHDKQEKQMTKILKDRPPRFDEEKSTNNTENETKILELETQNSNSESIKSKKTNKNKKQTPVASNEAAVDFEENACGDVEETSESEEIQDGATEELPFIRSVKYLEKHGIFRLFQNLAADIVYQRPDNPLQFIVEKLEEKQEYRRSQKESEKDQESHSTSSYL